MPRPLLTAACLLTGLLLVMPACSTAPAMPEVERGPIAFELEPTRELVEVGDAVGATLFVDGEFAGQDTIELTVTAEQASSHIGPSRSADAPVAAADAP